jgi:hypothetical protein
VPNYYHDVPLFMVVDDVEISFSYSKLDRKKDRQMALAP